MSGGEVPVRHEESTDTYRLEYDWWRDRSVATAIATAVSAITDTPPTDVEPIYDVVDPDALEDLYAPRSGAGLRCDSGSTSFRFHGCGVTLHSTGEIAIRPLDDADGVRGSERQ